MVARNVSGTSRIGTWRDERRHRKLVLKGVERPRLLVVAEVALTFVIVVYLTKICMLVAGMHSGLGRVSTSVFMLVFETLMMYLAFDSLIGISSNRPRSWRKTMRSGIAMIVMMALSNIVSRVSVGSSLVVFRTEFVLLIMVPTILIMMTKGVREYYTPPMTENRPLRDWIGYIGIGPLYGAERFELLCDGEE